MAADTHRRELSEAKTFLRWCFRRGWLPRLSLEEIDKVEPVGRKRSGPESKPQLRVDETRRWMAQALELAASGCEGAIAALVSLLFGLRPGEVRGLQVRDVDDGGRLLWVDGTKTKNARRKLDVPDLLQPLLLEQAARVPGPSLWQHNGVNWVYNWTRRICRRAGVPEVCAQAMRGLHSSLARESGATGHHVAAQLGHASEAMHEQAYADRAAVERGKQRRALKVLQGGGPPAPGIAGRHARSAGSPLRCEARRR